MHATKFCVSSSKFSLFSVYAENREIILYILSLYACIKISAFNTGMPKAERKNARALITKLLNLIKFF